MEKNSVIILDKDQINHKIKRIAYQIYESNVDEDEIILAGIADSGFELARRLRVELQEISDLSILLCEVKINKKDPLDVITTSLDPGDYRDKALVLIDDVLNSGTTLIYGVRHFLEVPLKRFKTAVLVDRSHKKYPVKADFKGISLSTSIHETVNVSFSEGEDRVELI
ncbi:phosphoribosyltransferase family protein [Salinimicrobium sp. HB62]|uniref:phosphoribosyltransferase family protein n=1 Tax=Salinimicrobium sp. HB62 TaxID=3077781 RepID=UPI002D77F0EF|nr:phosphoribosyltransferase family protein [Salinimicrobium sp. HB62]